MLQSIFLPKETVVVEQNTIIDPPFFSSDSHWTDSVLETMTLDQKIGQLFMVASYSNKHANGYVRSVSKLIKNYHIGGVIFFQGGPVRQAQMTNHYQSVTKIPLMIAQDAEWGLGMRLDSTIDYPHQIMLGAIQDESKIYEMGTEIARQCKRLGAHINFAPVIDINNNANNPIIGVRSFGEDRKNVASKGYAYMLGMQNQNVLAVGKHFPGHGDTDKDSHKDLPVINHKRARLDSIEMYPFRELIKKGLGGMMIAHLYIPALDTKENTPSSLSSLVVTDILKNQLDFKGLVFTDALGMQGVTKFHETGDADLKALLAGVDILLMSEDVPKAFSKIKQAIEDGYITEEELDKKCRKILLSKQWMGLDNYKPVKIKNLYEDLNSEQAQLVNRNVVEAGITLVQNNDKHIPFKDIDKVKIASLSIGTGNTTTFQNTMDLYAKVTHYVIDKDADFNQFKAMRAKLEKYDFVIIGIHDTRLFAPKSFGMTSNSINFIARLAEKTKIVLDIFGNPYSLRKFKNTDKIPAIIMSYEDTDVSQELSAQLIFGGIEAQGKLPITANKKFKRRTGIISKKIRLKYTLPLESRINAKKLQNLDTLIMGAIEEQAFPGCQVLIAKNGAIVFNKAFGYHTYKKKRLVKTTDLYDIASVTKITSTIPALMKLYDEKKFDVDKKMSFYLTELDSTDKKNIKIKDVLTHQARLKAWIPFYLRTKNRETNVLDTTVYQNYLSKKFNLQVTDNIFMNEDYVDVMYNRIYDSKLRDKKKYRYSDLGFYLFHKIIENITEENLEDYVAKNFYNPLGALSVGYLPLKKFSKNQITPTEDDNKFRKQIVHGYVHDYGAAMMGGIGGHAGLFANANDLAKILQMYMQNGEYGGKKYLNAETIDLFTKKQFKNNRRGLGFDRRGKDGKGPACKATSDKSYGHTGFTGCQVWVDPEHELIYIFLSNRIYPDIENKIINENNIRERIQAMIYKSFSG